MRRFTYVTASVCYLWFVTASAPETRLNDPLLYDIAMPLGATYHPLGFAVEVVSNSQDVLDAACQSWGRYQRAFETGAPIQLRIVVEVEGELPPEPKFRAQRGSVLLVADRDNFGMCDAAARRGFCFVSARTVADRAWFRWHFLEAMAYVLLAQKDVVPVHAACVVRNGTGVLLCGASGSGKSTLAFACARAGWQYAGDDAAWLLPDSDPPVAVGRCHQVRLRGDAPRLFPELAGYIAEPRPNGRLAIEAPLGDFPKITVAPQCRVGGMVMLDRRTGAAARARVVEPDEIVDSLIADLPSYGAEVTARYVRTVRGLGSARAWRLEYDRLDDAVAALSDLFPS